MADGSIATPWAADYASQSSEALLADLHSRRGGCGGWGVVRTAIFGFLTFGLAPALVWAFSVREQIDHSSQLSQLSQRQCHPLDRTVIRCASAEIAAFDAKIDRTTIYLPPEDPKPTPIVRSYSEPLN